MRPTIEVRKVPLPYVSDASELAKLIDDGVLEADRVIAVIGRTDRNGGVKIIADRAFREVVVARGSRTLDQVKQGLVSVLLKWEASQDGMVRGRRNAMLGDSDVHWHRQIKACVGGVTASVTGDSAVFV